jgi:hypothetical protein
LQWVAYGILEAVFVEANHGKLIAVFERQVLQKRLKPLLPLRDLTLVLHNPKE